MLLAWLTELHKITDGQVIAIDGKTKRDAMLESAADGHVFLSGGLTKELSDRAASHLRFWVQSQRFKKARRRSVHVLFC